MRIGQHDLLMLRFVAENKKKSEQSTTKVTDSTHLISLPGCTAKNKILATKVPTNLLYRDEAYL
jgi:hypothetical protein